eukprot:gene20065-biopygen28877
MSRAPSLPEEIVSDVVLRALRLGAPLSDLSVVCRSWHAAVAQNLAEIAEILIDRHQGAMSKALCLAFDHNHGVLACELASRPQSVEDSNLALSLAALYGRADVVKLLLDAPQHGARANIGMQHTGVILEG